MQQTEQIIEQEQLKIVSQLELERFEQVKYCLNETFVFGVKVNLGDKWKGFVYLKSSPVKKWARENWHNCHYSFYELGNGQGYVGLSINGVRLYDDQARIAQTIELRKSDYPIHRRLELLSNDGNIRGLEAELNSLLGRV